MHDTLTHDSAEVGVQNWVVLARSLISDAEAEDDGPVILTGYSEWSRLKMPLFNLET